MYSIQYNPHTKQYDVKDAAGILESFPNGDAGRQAARETALKANDAEAYAAAFYLANNLFRHRPDLRERIWSAAEIITEKRITRPPHYRQDDRHVAIVHTDGKFHRIYKTPAGKYSCTCPDFQFKQAPRNGSQPLCKHIIAYKMIKVMDQGIPPHPTLSAAQPNTPVIEWKKPEWGADLDELSPVQIQEKELSRARSAGRSHRAAMRDAARRAGMPSPYAI